MNRKVTYLLFAFSIIFLTGFQGYNTNAKIKSLFIYNFTKYIEWPSSYKKGNFVIGVLGESPLYPELYQFLKSKKASLQPFEIKRFEQVSDITNCHIVLLPRGRSDELDACLKKIGSNSTLVITEQDGLAKKGAGINFVIENNRQKFELNKHQVEQRDLKISNNLLNLAILVE